MILRQKSWIDLANEHVHIADVLNTLGVFVPESVKSGGTKKVHCPFGFYHSDNGLTKAMRVYGNSNTAYCFSCSKSYSPVTLASAAWDCSWHNAAFRLLEDSGFKPKSLQERWAEASTKEVNKPDLIALGEALKTYCSIVYPNWEQDQLNDYVGDKLNKCLSLLDLVETDEDATKWLQTCKTAMSKHLETL
jgi:hypothetical protein